MRKRLLQAIEQQQPVDIYFNIGVNGGETKCVLMYKAFLPIDIKGDYFEGYTEEERLKKNPAQKLLTTDNILAICEIV